MNYLMRFFNCLSIVANAVVSFWLLFMMIYGGMWLLLTLGGSNFSFLQWIQEYYSVLVIYLSSIFFIWLSFYLMFFSWPRMEVRKCFILSLLQVLIFVVGYSEDASDIFFSPLIIPVAISASAGVLFGIIKKNTPVNL